MNIKEFFKKYNFLIILIFIITLIAIYKPLNTYAACRSHGACSNCKYDDSRGCSWTRRSGDYSCNCAGTTLYCYPGGCASCTPPGCPTGYTTTNTGCSTTSTSCTRRNCVGSCGTSYRTCYKIQYTVSYNSNGGSCSPSSRSICYLETSSGPSCSRTGYTLTGFTRISGSGGSLNTSNGTVTSVSGDQTIRANWSINQYTVSYDGNGGTCSPSSRVVNYGSTSSAPSCSRTGYTLTSFTRTSGSGGSLNTSTGTVTSVSGNQTIRANWSINQYTVSYDANGGTCTPSSRVVNYGLTSSGPSCSKTGYTLSGFTRTSGSGGSLNTSNGTVTSVSGNQTITANWDINQYTVTFNGNGGLCTPSTQVVNYGSNSSVPTCTREGYHIIGFNRVSGSGGTLNTSTGQVTSVTGTQTIEPLWELSNVTPTAPTDLQTDAETNPNYLTNINPKFSAIFNDPDTEDIAEHYQIQVNTNSDFSGTIMWDSGKTAMTPTQQGTRSPNITYDGSTLSYDGSTYYWRIKFWDSSDVESPWSATPHAQFTMAVPAAVYYEIEVNSSADFSGTVLWDSGKTTMTPTIAGQRSPEISYNGTTLNRGITYYWRIRFWDMVDNVSDWSETATFEINQPPSAPTDLLTEESDTPTKVYDTTPELSAIYNDIDNEDKAEFYQIQVNTQNNFNGVVMWDSGKTSISPTNEGERIPDISYAGNPLNPGITYYWRIKLWDTNDNESPWSLTTSFIMSGPPSATELFITGLEDPEITPANVFFSAAYSDPNSDNATNYQIEVNSNSDFSGTIMWDSTKTSITITSGNRSPDIEYNGTPLNDDGTTYYVRMRFWDIDDNTSNWTTGQFTDTRKRLKLDGINLGGISFD
jgi:hypothetical protein